MSDRSNATLAAYATAPEHERRAFGGRNSPAFFPVIPRIWVSPEPDRCAACGADWDDGPIPEDMRQHYAPPHRWTRRIALVDRGRDKVMAWKCPDCGNQVRVSENG